MTSRIVPVPECDLVIFGGTGDLARRKILPSLFHRFVDGQLPNTSRVVGVARSEQSTEDYRKWVGDAIVEHMGAGVTVGA